MKYLISAFLLSVVLFIGYYVACFVEVILLPEEQARIEERFTNPVTARVIRQDNLGNCSYQKVATQRKIVCKKPQPVVELDQFNQYATNSEVYYSAPSTYYGWGTHVVYLLPLQDQVLQVNVPLVVSKTHYVRGKVFTLMYSPGSVRIEPNGDLTLVSYARADSEIGATLAGILLLSFFSMGWTGIYLADKKKKHR